MKQFTQWREYFYSAAKVARNFELPKIFAIFLHLPLPKSFISLDICIHIRYLTSNRTPIIYDNRVSFTFSERRSCSPTDPWYINARNNNYFPTFFRARERTIL